MRAIKARPFLSMSVAVWVAALGGCEEATMVGSGCPNGVCPNALSRNDDACTSSETVAQIAISQSPDAPQEQAFAEICLPRALTPKDDGMVEAHIFYILPAEPADPPIHCVDKPFLRPVSAALREAYGGHDGEICELNQLAVFEADGGAPTVAAGDGFFYDDFSRGELSRCSVPSVLMRITAGATPWNGVVVDFVTTETFDANGELDATLSCEPRTGSEPVGTPCLPEREEYSDNDVVIQTRSVACGDGVCIAYHLEGNTDPSCDPSEESGDPLSQCATPEQIEDRAYCTCRCDGPPGSDLCECPSGFSCVDAVSTFQPELAGRYCVKNGMVAQ